MINLWVDDVRIPFEATWVWAQTGAAAMEILQTGIVDLASLDHDLGLTGPDGSALVRWMAETNHWPKQRPICHSQNPVGRLYMEGVIDRYGPY